MMLTKEQRRALIEAGPKPRFLTKSAARAARAVKEAAEKPAKLVVDRGRVVGEAVVKLSPSDPNCQRERTWIEERNAVVASRRVMGSLAPKVEVGFDRVTNAEVTMTWSVSREEFGWRGDDKVVRNYNPFAPERMPGNDE